MLFVKNGKPETDIIGPTLSKVEITIEERFKIWNNTKNSRYSILRSCQWSCVW